MINLNSYNVDNHVYSLNENYQLGKDLVKIVMITNINDTIFFFCEKQDGVFLGRVDQTTSIEMKTIPVNALIFHKAILKSLLNNNN
jgi:hypothetical protein